MGIFFKLLLMADTQKQHESSVENVQVTQNNSMKYQSSTLTQENQNYLDPQGGYIDEDLGKEAEKIAMTSQCNINVNALPTKAYLDSTIVPTVMKALSEVCEARPDNPLEFVAYYMLKHNPNRKLEGEGQPIGHYHP